MIDKAAEASFLSIEQATQGQMLKAVHKAITDQLSGEAAARGSGETRIRQVYGDKVRYVKVNRETRMFFRRQAGEVTILDFVKRSDRRFYHGES